MKEKSKILAGSFFIILGLVLIVIAPKTHFITLIYGIPLFILGFFVLTNNQEDEIELRKDLNKKKTGR